MLVIKEPKVYIIIVNYKGWKDTMECLESIFKSDYINFEVIVVDNGSLDESFKNLKDWASGAKEFCLENSLFKELVFPLEEKPIPHGVVENSILKSEGYLNIRKLTLIKSEENLGFAGGNNIGIRFAQSNNDFDYLWFLNNDTVISPDCLSNLVTCAEANQGFGILGSKLLFYSNPGTIQAIGGKYNKYLGIAKHLGEGESNLRYCQEEVYTDLDYVIGASMLVRRPFIEQVGLMNEEYFLYFEELDWDIRGQLKGWQSGTCLQSVLYHKEGASAGSGNWKVRSHMSEYIISLNKINFTKKYYPKFIWTLYLGFLLILANRIRRRQFKRFFIILKIMINPKLFTPQYFMKFR